MVLKQIIEAYLNQNIKDGSEEGWSLIAPLLPGSLKECYKQGYYHSSEGKRSSLSTEDQTSLRSEKQ